MKKLPLTILAVFIACAVSLAQQKEKEKKDTLFVRVLSKYVLVDGKKTSDYCVEEQEFRDTLNRLLNVINFDDATHVPITYSRYTYSGMNRVKEEHFANNKMVWRISLGYDAAGNVTSRKVEKVIPGDTAIYLNISYKNNAAGKPIAEVGTTAGGAVAYKVKLSYDKSGELVMKRASVKNLPPMDSVLLLKRKPFYDSLKRVVAEALVLKKVGGVDAASRTEYKFGKEGFLSEKTIYSSGGVPTQREEHIYNIQRKRIQEIKTFDGKGNLLEWRAYRYERYGSQPHMVRVID